MTRFYCFFFSTLENICTVKFFFSLSLSAHWWNLEGFSGGCWRKQKQQIAKKKNRNKKAILTTQFTKITFLRGIKNDFPINAWMNEISLVAWRQMKEKSSRNFYWWTGEFNWNIYCFHSSFQIAAKNWAC